MSLRRIKITYQNFLKMLLRYRVVTVRRKPILHGGPGLPRLPCLPLSSPVKKCVAIRTSAEEPVPLI